MLKKLIVIAGLMSLLAMNAVQADDNTPRVASKAPITAAEVGAFQQAWGEGIVEIGKTFSDGGDYRTEAAKHLEKFYAYGKNDVLFKPTLASEDQFRGTFDEALSYFVTGTVKEDKGFAIAPYTRVRWENEGTIIGTDSAMSMGNYYFTKKDGKEIKVEYSFGMERMDNGELKIILHHSSIPYPSS